MVPGGLAVLFLICSARFIEDVSTSPWNSGIGISETSDRLADLDPESCLTKP